jgi:AcrR family transcriptional regulator
MSRIRKYNSETRVAQAEATKKNILTSAKSLFTSKGFEKTTIGGIAVKAKVSPPTVYALFKSKEGILKELIQVTLFGPQYELLIEKYRALEDPIEALKIAAPITRAIYDAENTEIAFLRGACFLSPELNKISRDVERQRYERQEPTILKLQAHHLLKPGLDVKLARDIMWTLTSYENYRLLVIESEWPSDDYEKWLSDLLVRALVKTEGLRLKFIE